MKKKAIFTILLTVVLRVFCAMFVLLETLTLSAIVMETLIVVDILIDHQIPTQPQLGLLRPLAKIVVEKLFILGNAHLQLVDHIKSLEVAPLMAIVLAVVMGIINSIPAKMDMKWLALEALLVVSFLKPVLVRRKQFLSWAILAQVVPTNQDKSSIPVLALVLVISPLALIRVTARQIAKLNIASILAKTDILLMEVLALKIAFLMIVQLTLSTHRQQTLTMTLALWAVVVQ